MRISNIVIAFGFSILSLSARAQNCPVQDMTDSAAIKNAINLSTSCGNASDVAESCAWGSSMDRDFVSAAVAICMKPMKLDRNEAAMFAFLNNKCDLKFKSVQGTMYIAMNAFCRLDVVKLFSELKSPLQ